MSDIDYTPKGLVKALAVLKEFCDDVDATGGLEYLDDDLTIGPVADPEWTDLAKTYIKACVVLGREPVYETGSDDDIVCEQCCDTFPDDGSNQTLCADCQEDEDDFDDDGE